MKFLLQPLHLYCGLNKIRDNIGNWREQIHRVEKDILKVAVRYSVQGEKTERGKLRVLREPERVQGMVT